jgi:hypothetical protein
MVLAVRRKMVWFVSKVSSPLRKGRVGCLGEDSSGFDFVVELTKISKISKTCPLL